jgi:hypothetical protein
MSDNKGDIEQEITDILTENCYYNAQVKGVVVHGAIQKIAAIVKQKDEEIQKLMSENAELRTCEGHYRDLAQRVQFGEIHQLQEENTRLRAQVEQLTQLVKDYEEVDKDRDRLVREMDVIMNGENAAKQASLCDMVSQAQEWKSQLSQSFTLDEIEAALAMSDAIPDSESYLQFKESLTNLKAKREGKV